jgi:DNA-binding CsgD family transcriptional regulator
MLTTITPRQLEYAQAYIAAEPRRSVAARLGVSVATVDHMMRRVRAKFGADRELVRWATMTARVSNTNGGRCSASGLRPGDAVEILGGRFAGKRGEYAGSANSTQIRVRIGGGTFAVRRRFVHRDWA